MRQNNVWQQKQARAIYVAAEREKCVCPASIAAEEEAGSSMLRKFSSRNTRVVNVGLVANSQCFSPQLLLSRRWQQLHPPSLAHVRSPLCFYATLKKPLLPCTFLTLSLALDLGPRATERVTGLSLPLSVPSGRRTLFPSFLFSPLFLLLAFSLVCAG